MNALNVPSTPAETRGDSVADMDSLALKLMEKDKGDKDNADLRTALLKAQVEGAEGQAKILKDHTKVVEVGARPNFLTKMLLSGVLSDEQTIKVRDELFSLSGIEYN